LCIPSSTFTSPGKRRRRKEEGKINKIPHNFSMICGVPFKWNTLTPIMQRLDTGVNKFPRLVRFMITRSFTIHYSESNGRGVVAI
jgi:hypothetical protein